MLLMEMIIFATFGDSFEFRVWVVIFGAKGV